MKKEEMKEMVKNVITLPYDGSNPLPNYVTGIRKYTLVGTAPGGYKVILGRLTVGESESLGKPLAHALFESFTDHGDRAKVARTRVSGSLRGPISVQNAMGETGIEFDPTKLYDSCEGALRALGDWIIAHNTDFSEVSVVSQTCH